MKKKFFTFFFVLLSFLLFANPFSSKKKSPSPVFQGKPPEHILKTQRILNEKLGNYITDWKENRNLNIFFSVLALSFLYGIIHAAGPGHRKTVVFSFYLTKEAEPLEPLMTSLFLAGIHGGTAIAIMLIFKGISGAVSANSNNTVIYMEGISFIILIILAVYGILDTVFDIIKKKHAEHKKIKLGAILLSGMYPCPAAMLILVLAVSLDVFFLGFCAVIVLSIGMSVPIIICAYSAWAGRTGLFYKLKNNGKILILISGSLQIIGYGLLLFISVKTALPFILSLWKIV